jgi:hypothetical protein
MMHFSCTKVFTWKFLFDNGESKYKCFLKQTQNNVVYVKPCFVTPFGSNARQLRIKPRVQRMVHATTNWMGN